MFGKLIKHEFRATGRILLPLMAALLGISILAGPVMTFVTNRTDSRFVAFAQGLLTVIVVLLMLAVFVAAFVLMIQRFYRNLFQDEGYISMTLPVSADEHIFAKLIVSTVWYVLSFIIFMAALLTLINAEIDFGELRELGYAVSEASREIGAGNIILFAVECIIGLVAASFIACLRFYAAIAIGCSFNDHKVLMSVVFFFVLGAVVNTLQVIAGLSLANSDFVIGLEDRLSAMVQTVQGVASMIHGIMWIGILFFIIIGALYYIPTTLLMRKKLNLA